MTKKTAAPVASPAVETPPADTPKNPLGAAKAKVEQLRKDLEAAEKGYDKLLQAEFHKPKARKT